jgi:hypothetical protein
MRSRSIVLSGLVLVLAAAAGASAAGPVVGKVAEANGKVWLIPAGATDDGKKAVAVGQEVREGDTLVTEAGSTAKVDFTDESTIKVGEKSKCAIRKKSTKPGKATKLHLFTGKMRVKVKADKVARGLFQVSTPTAVAGVRGTDWLTIAERTSTRVIVFSGLLKVENLMKGVAGVVDVPAKHMTRIRMGRPPIAPVQLKDAELQQMDKALSLAKEEKTEEKKEEAGAEKKEEAKTEEKTAAGGEPPASEEPAPAEEPLAGSLGEIAEETSTDVMNEETQETVQEEVQEVSAERLPEPPGPPSE